MKKRIALTIALGFFGVSINAATVAYYEFDGSGTATNGSTVADSTGNHNGTVAGGDLVYGTDPLIGAYLSFAADATGTANTGNRIVIPGAADLTFTVDQTYTFEVIFRTTQTAVGVLVSKGSDTSNPDSQWWIRHTGAGRVAGLIEGTDNITEDSATSGGATALVGDGQWHHMALVFDGTVSPKKLEIYIDGVLGGADASVGTAGVVGGVDADPFVIGEYASGAANRSYAGDIAAVRLSNTPLTPAEFLPLGFTYITDITPEDNASFLPPSTVASFVVNSPSVGVAQTNIEVLLNGVDISSQLSFSGTDAQRTVTLPALSANQMYRMQISVTDYASNVVTRSTQFNTFVNNLVFVEGEDYNFESGGFIDNPPLSSTPGANSYLDRFGSEGIDYHQTNAPGATLYRIGDQVGTAVSTDLPLRQAYLDAQISDPGVADYMVRDNANTEWLNYTRTFPAANYRVYARVAKSGTVPIVMQLDEVTSGSTSTSQTLAPIGSFYRLPTPAANIFDFIPLTDALGQEVALPLSGVKTLRLTMVSGTAGLVLNYLLFVPVGVVQPPFLASVSPVAGEGNALFNSTIGATIRNGDATVTTGTIQLRLDGTGVSASVTPTSYGALVSYTPSTMSTSLHTATLIYTDSTAATITNEWQFYVANQAVRGYWRFNEQTAGNTVSTAPGAILDSSGNSRNGTAAAEGQLYVPGSFNFGNTPALNFTTGADRVVVADSSGNFNYTDSFTFEAIVRTTNTATGAAILAKNGTGDGEGEYWWRAPGVSGGKQRFSMNGIHTPGTNTLNDGNWHHLAAVYDATLGEIRLYFDYSIEAVTSGVLLDKPVGRPADLQIGGFIGTTTSEFSGDIDSIRISNGALTPAEFIQPTVALQPLVSRTLPADGARNVAPRATIAAEIQNRDTSVVLSSLKLFVDGADMTASSTKADFGTGAKISYVPASALASGLHTATVTFNDTAVPVNSWTNSWSFTVTNFVPTTLALYQFNEKDPFNEADSTPGAILDSSGLGRHLTAAGFPLPYYTTGSPTYGNSSALTFTAGDDNVFTANTEGLNFGVEDSFTVEAVIRTAPGATFTGNIVGRDWGSALPSWWFRMESGAFPRFYVEGTGAGSVTSGIAANDGEWHHVAAVRDAVTRKVLVYVDYNLAGEGVDATTTPLTNAQNLIIGAYNAGTRQFEGDIDVVRIMTDALDPSWFIPLGGIAPAVVLQNPTIVGNNISFSFATENGRSYLVEATENLGTSWTTVETVTGDGTVKTVSYPASAPRQFYQVRVQ